MRIQQTLAHNLVERTSGKKTQCSGASVQGNANLLAPPKTENMESDGDSHVTWKEDAVKHKRSWNFSPARVSLTGFRRPTLFLVSWWFRKSSFFLRIIPVIFLFKKWQKMSGWKTDCVQMEKKVNDPRRFLCVKMLCRWERHVTPRVAVHCWTQENHRAPIVKVIVIKCVSQWRELALNS